MKKRELNKLIKLVPFLPLTVFVLYARRYVITYDDWGAAFFVGGGTALVQMLYFWHQKMRFDRFLWAINLFLVTGAFGFLIAPVHSGIVQLYAQFDEAMLMFWVVLVGVYTTFYTKTGFVDVQSTNAKNVRRASLMLLNAAVLAFGASFYLRGNLLLAGALPFIAVRVMRQVLINCLFKRS